MPTVFNSVGSSDSDKFDTKFTNRRPIVAGLQDSVVNPGQAVAIPIRAIDPEGYPVTYLKRAGEPGEFDGTSESNRGAQQIRLREAPKVHANFASDKLEGKAPLTVRFSAQGSHGGAKVEWAFAPRAPGKPAMPKAEATTPAMRSSPWAAAPSP
jgi:PKD repeat protein